MSYIYIIIFIITLFVIVYNIEYTEFYETSIHNRTLSNDGLCVLYSSEYLDSGEKPCSLLERDIISQLPPGYVFLDYSYEIVGGSLSTFHRDVTSSANILGCVNPVYTLILYKCEGELFSFCPASNYTFPFVWSHIVTIFGSPGTSFLFDCDLLHAGTLTICEKRWAIQYKICHIEDIGRLSELYNVHAVKKGEICRDKTWIDYLLRKLSYYFEFPFNYIFYPIMQRKYGGLTGWIQDQIPIQFYNNT